MTQALQVLFHGINRSQAAEEMIQEKFEALQKFDQQLGAGKVTISQEGHQTIGAFTAQIDVLSAGHPLIAKATNLDINAAINEMFDTIRRVVKEEAEKRRHH